MGSSTDGSPAARGALDGSADEPSPEPGQRGFFGRLLSAFSPASDAATPETATGSSAAPQGLHVLRRMRVDDVAIPKAEIVAVPLDIGKDELVAVFREHGFSRVPVYKGTLDHPQGLVLRRPANICFGGPDRRTCRTRRRHHRGIHRTPRGTRIRLNGRGPCPRRR